MGKSRKRTKVFQKELPDRVVVSYNNAEVELTRDDMGCILPGQFLSEVVLDFFIFKRATECTDPLSMDVCSTRFYSELVKPQLIATASNVPDHVNDALRRVNYLDVQHLHPRFFSSSFVHIPVHVHDNHWVLAVVYLRHCPAIHREGAIIIFDSSQGPLSHETHQSICTHIRDFMNCHWCLKHQWGNVNVSRVFTPDTCPMCVAEVPQQRNGYDCGLYVLKASEAVMNNASDIAEKCALANEDVVSMSTYFRDKMIFDSVGFREELLNEIREY